MVKFSPAGSIMFIKQEGESFVFYCPKTGYTEKAEEKDFRVFHKEYTIKTVDSVDYYSNLRSLCDEPTVPKVQGDCPTCKKKQKLAQIRNKDYSITNICCVCYSYFKL